jgi:imidazolonepropionase-like amidohydrolase
VRVSASLTVALLVACAAAAAQAQNPTPAAAQARPVVLTGGTIHVGDGRTVIENGTVAFDKGKLTYVGPAAGFTPDRATMDVRDVAGQHVYPGLILANSTLGLTDIEAIRATVDEREVGPLNPNVRALVAYNTDSDIQPTVRTNGVLTVQITPRGGTLSGQSSIVQLDAWNWEDAVVRPDDGLHLNWPGYLPRTGVVPDSIVQKRNKARETALRELELLFTDARAYRATPAASRPVNLRLAALDAVLAGRQTLFLHADAAKEIVESVRWAKRLGIPNMAVVGAQDAARVTDFLKENGVPVVLTRLHSLPRRNDDDVDQTYRLPKILADAGVPFCLSYEGDMENPGARNLAFTAGTAVAYGLPPEQALYAMTGSSARILGLPQQGTLTTGLDATVVVSRGDLLDMRTNAVTSAFIQGRALDLRNKQQGLAEKYRTKYGQK